MKDSSSVGANGRGKLAGIGALLVLCGGIAWLALALWRGYQPAEQDPTPGTGFTVTPAFSVQSGSTPAPNGKLGPTPTVEEPAGLPNVPPAIDQRPIPERGLQDLEALFSVVSPVHDYFIASEELGGFELGERTVASAVDQLGDRATFNTADGPRQAELVYVDDLAAYWVEVGLTLDRAALFAAAERLRSAYYPLLVRNFGSEWRPGIDGDSRFTVLHLMGAPGAVELGYFTDENQYPRALFTQSNQREMVYLNMSELEPGSPLYDGTLVHEVQHLIQWNLDANEDKWLNEGLSQVAETMVGLDTVDPRAYTEQSFVRLDRWSDATSEVHAHYAGSYLYVSYLWKQLGDAALAELTRHPANGLAAVRAVLAGHRPDVSLERFTADWVTAIYLDGRSADGRFNFQSLDLPQPFHSARARQLPFERVAALEQYGVDYIDLDFEGRATISFAGDTAASITDGATAGSFWFAPPANSSRPQLTAVVDLSGLPAAVLSFETWYDLEPGYDFAYLSISTDGGTTWNLLEPNHSVSGAYGPAWGGRSRDTTGHVDGWLRESIDLAGYSGRQVWLRFEALTDFDEPGRGFAIRDPNIHQLPEQIEWRPDGFVSTGSMLPQLWEVRLIRESVEPEVIPVILNELNQAQFDVELGPEGGALIVMPLTPFVETAADYWLYVSD
jgi:hypothetical protein